MIRKDLILLTAISVLEKQPQKTHDIAHPWPASNPKSFILRARDPDDQFAQRTLHAITLEPFQRQNLSNLRTEILLLAQLIWYMSKRI